MNFNKIEEDFVALLDKIENDKLRSYLKQGIKKIWFVFYRNNLNYETINSYIFIRTFLENNEIILNSFDKKLDELKIETFDENISSKDFFYLSLFIGIILIFSGQHYDNLYFNGEYENNEKIFFTDSFFNIKKHLLGISTINLLKTGKIFDILMEDKNNKWLISFLEIFSSYEKYSYFKNNIIDFIFKDFFFCCESKSISFLKENSLINKSIEYKQKKILSFVHKIINLNLFLCKYSKIDLNNINFYEKKYRYNLMTYILKYLKNNKNSIFYGSLNEAYKSLQSFDKYDFYEKAYVYNDLKKLSDKLLNYNLSHIKDMYENGKNKMIYEPKVQLLDMIGYFSTKMHENYQRQILNSISIENIEIKDDLLFSDIEFLYQKDYEQIFKKNIEDSLYKLKNFGIIINQS